MIPNSLIVDGASEVAVTWSAAVHVVTETPVFRLDTHTVYSHLSALM